MSLSTLSLVTSDNAPISVLAIITYHVRNTRNYLLRMGDQEESLSDIGPGVVKQAIRDHGWEYASDIDDVLKNKLQRDAAKYGFVIHEFKLVQISPKEKIIQ